MSRYQVIDEAEDVYAGADGKKDTPQDTVNFLEYFGDIILQFIEAVKQFLDSIGFELNA